MTSGSLISRLYDFIDGQVVHEFHIDEELDRIHEWLNGKLGDINLASDADIQGTKVKIGSIPLDRLAESVASSDRIAEAITEAQFGAQIEGIVTNRPGANRHFTMKQDGQDRFAFALDEDGNLLISRKAESGWVTVATFTLEGALLADASTVGGMHFAIIDGALQTSSDGSAWDPVKVQRTVQIGNVFIEERDGKPQWSINGTTWNSFETGSNSRALARRY